jgi:hypothetical protein
VRILNPRARQLQKGKLTTASLSSPSLSSPSSSWELRFWYPVFAVLLLAVMMGQGNSVAASDEGGVLLLQTVVNGYQRLWLSLGGEPLPHKVVVDALTTLLAYPVTTFCIRRALNPDTGE